MNQMTKLFISYWLGWFTGMTIILTMLQYTVLIYPLLFIVFGAISFGVLLYWYGES